jgi:hypothetical protein
MPGVDVFVGSFVKSHIKAQGRGGKEKSLPSDAFVKNPNCHPERSEGSLRKTKCIIIADG